MDWKMPHFHINHLSVNTSQFVYHSEIRTFLFIQISPLSGTWTHRYCINRHHSENGTKINRVCVRKLILQQLMVDGMCDEDCPNKTPSTQCCVGCDMALQKALSLWQPQSPHTKQRRRYPALCYINRFVVYFCYVIYNKCYIPDLKLYCCKNIPLNQTTCPSPLPKHTEDKTSLQWGHMNIIGCEMNGGKAIAQHILRYNMEESSKALHQWPFVNFIHTISINSSHKGPLMRKCLGFSHVII